MILYELIISGKQRNYLLSLIYYITYEIDKLKIGINKDVENIIINKEWINIQKKKELIKSNIDIQDMGDKIIIGFHYKNRLLDL